MSFSASNFGGFFFLSSPISWAKGGYLGTRKERQPEKQGLHARAGLTRKICTLSKRRTSPEKADTERERESVCVSEREKRTK